MQRLERRLSVNVSSLIAACAGCQDAFDAFILPSADKARRGSSCGRSQSSCRYRPDRKYVGQESDGPCPCDNKEVNVGKPVSMRMSVRSQHRYCYYYVYNSDMAGFCKGPRCSMSCIAPRRRREGLSHLTVGQEVFCILWSISCLKTLRL